MTGFVKWQLKKRQKELTINCVAFQAFNSLGEAAYDAAQVSDDEEEPQTYVLSTWFQQIVGKLLEVTDRYENNDEQIVCYGTFQFKISFWAGHCTN